MAEPIKLLPCPFCGGPAFIVEGDESAYVQCVDMKMHRALWFSGDNNAADEVSEQWNRRPALEALTARNAGLERGRDEAPKADWQVDAFDATLAMARARRMDGLGGSTDLGHLEGMRKRLSSDMSPAKVGRWLGWAQCAVVACGAATLEEMKDLNRAAEARAALAPAQEGGS